MDKLNFTPLAVMNVEKELNARIGDIITQPSMTNALVLVKHGLELAEDDLASAEIATFFAGKYSEKRQNDLDSLYLKIVQKLKEQGFLSRALDLEILKEAVEDPESALKKLSSSTNSGKSARKQLL